MSRELIKEVKIWDYSFFQIESTFLTQINVLPMFELVKSEIKLVYQKAFFMRKPEIDQHISIKKNLGNWKSHDKQM